MERSRRGAWLDRVILPLRKGRILWRLIILYAVVCAAPILIFGGLYRARYTAELRQKLGSPCSPTGRTIFWKTWSASP